MVPLIIIIILLERGIPALQTTRTFIFDRLTQKGNRIIQLALLIIDLLLLRGRFQLHNLYIQSIRNLILQDSCCLVLYLCELLDVLLVGQYFLLNLCEIHELDQTLIHVFIGVVLVDLHLGQELLHVEVVDVIVLH